MWLFQGEYFFLRTTATALLYYLSRWNVYICMSLYYACAIWWMDLYSIRAYSHQRCAFFSAAEILLRIYQNPIHLKGARWRTTFFRLLRIFQNPIHLNGTRWRTRFWRQREVRRRKNVVRQRAPFKCMVIWYIRSRISAAEKTRVFGVNRPSLYYLSRWNVYTCHCIRMCYLMDGFVPY